jgi:hypothetical protein
LLLALSFGGEREKQKTKNSDTEQEQGNKPCQAALESLKKAGVGEEEGRSSGPQLNWRAGALCVIVKVLEDRECRSPKACLGL